jgi:hypothetical protein
VFFGIVPNNRINSDWQLRCASLPSGYAHRYAKEQMNEIIEAVGKIIEGGFGFRYLFSRTYRKRTQQRWKNQSKISIAFEVFEAAIGVAFIILILFVLLGIVQ